MPNHPIPPSFAATTPIRYLDAEGAGTGFFLNAQERTFIVTNRHVLDPEDASPNRVRIYLRDGPNLAQTNPYDINISGGEGTDWFGHPRVPEVDVAVIPIEPRLDSLDDVGDARTGNLGFTPNHFIHENVQVDQRVSILGYPGNFVDSRTLFPIRRNALIASPYGLPFNEMPCFVTDAHMHPGMSGSPVIMETGGMMMTRGDVPEERQTGIYLLGIHSGEWYQISNQTGEGEPEIIQYQLNAAWYPEILGDILTAI